MSNQTTSTDTPNAISLPVSADGATHCALQDGPTIGPYGREAAPASHSAKRGGEKDLRTIGTYGPNLNGSLQSDTLQEYLENRLRPLLNGSVLCEVIWKPWVTPWGQHRLKPRARARSTFETESGLW